MPAHQGSQLLVFFFLGFITAGTQHLRDLFLCVCVKVQEDGETAGSERRQDECTPAVFFGPAGP